MDAEPHDWRAFALGAAVAVIGPVVLELAMAAGLLSQDAFWAVTVFVVTPLTGLLVGGVVRARVPGRRATAAMLAVPAGLALGWVVAMLLSAVVDPSPRQDTALVLFFALLSMLLISWWTASILVAMAVAWLIVYGFRRALSSLA